MYNIMICENCKIRQVSVHITQIGQGYKKEINLCLFCLNEKGLNSSFVYLSDMLGNVIKEFITMNKAGRKKSLELVCGGCSMPFDRFFETGLLGCPECYDSFEFELKKILHRFHGSTKHITDSSIRMSKPQLSEITDVKKLQTDLQSAVKEENFEKAAELRDRLKLLLNM